MHIHALEIFTSSTLLCLGRHYTLHFIWLSIQNTSDCVLTILAAIQLMALAFPSFPLKHRLVPWTCFLPLSPGLPLTSSLSLHLPPTGFLSTMDHAGFCSTLSTIPVPSSKGLREKPSDCSAVGGALVPAQSQCSKCLILTDSQRRAECAFWEARVIKKLAVTCRHCSVTEK